ncbi:hypothetical protein IV500_03005 [Paeniglutamicibacter antarcticus]|uniref:Uncharacterized protein n=1 Tax=Arthrobacter terrae TaxID=2935737 RepID=A0A931CP30_9MICC|nr:hypothetical protein [Arthrobacter terrae]
MTDSAFDLNGIFDFSTASTAVVFADKPVVYRSGWIVRAWAAAQQAGKKVIVLTPSNAALTLPLSELLSRSGCQRLAV